MVAAMAASLDAAYPGASSSTLCEVCQQEPHAVDDCPLVRRLATGDDEEPSNKNNEEEEEGGWQEVKAAPAKPPRQHGAKGSQQGKGNRAVQQGKGNSAAQQGKGKKALAGGVVTVSRGNSTNRYICVFNAA